MEALILASASPRRRKLLQQINMEFQILPSQCEEIITGNAPDQVVQALAKQKAEDVLKKVNQTGRIVLGADTVVAMNDTILGKPTGWQEAASMIRRLLGREHQVYTGVCLSYLKMDGAVVSKVFYEKTSVLVYPMSEEEIDAYIQGKYQRDKKGRLEWEDKAGAYGIQGCFAAFIKEIRGDYNNVVGLPVARVYQELKILRATKG